jgi:hypothetical protein
LGGEEEEEEDMMEKCVDIVSCSLYVPLSPPVVIPGAPVPLYTVGAPTQA